MCPLKLKSPGLDVWKRKRTPATLRRSQNVRIRPLPESVGRQMRRGILWLPVRQWLPKRGVPTKVKWLHILSRNPLPQPFISQCGAHLPLEKLRKLDYQIKVSNQSESKWIPCSSVVWPPRARSLKSDAIDLMYQIILCVGGELAPQVVSWPLWTVASTFQLPVVPSCLLSWK